MKTLEISLLGQTFDLHPNKAVFWVEQDALIVSDTHFGKISHFRKSGFPIPTKAIQDNWNRLAEVLKYYQPSQIIYLGDLFHSDYNLEWDDFAIIRDTFPSIDQRLIMGNHDVLHQEFYHLHELECMDSLEIGPFLFTHEPKENTSLYNIHGHIHPGAKLRGKGRQSIKLSCFYFGENLAILPAFGSFTGLATCKIKSNDRVFVILEDEILPVN